MADYARISTSDFEGVEMTTLSPQEDYKREMAIDFAHVDKNDLSEEDENDEESDLQFIEGEWHLVPNLDSFFTKIYQYFYQRGYWNILVSRLLNALTILFIIVFTLFLFIWIDWNSLYYCDKQECMNVHRFRDEPFSDLNRFHIGVLVVEGVFIAYWFVVVLKSLYDLREMWEIKHFYNNELHISETDIQTITWSEVAETLVRLQQRKRLSIVKNQLSAHDIVNRIMRRENYMIAFINKDILNLSVPLPFFKGRKVLTKTLEWNLRYIINYMFDDHLSIREEFLSDPNKLYRRFIWLGIINFIAAPFLIIFLLVFFFFKYTAIFREKPSSLGLRKWSPLALWKFREFNELPHLFKKRMDASYAHAKQYTEQFPLYLVSSIGRFIMFVASSFAAVIIVISVLKYPVLLYTEFFGQNLLWWLGIFTIVIATSRSLVIEEHTVFEPNVAAKKVAEFTHYMPKHWRGKCHHKSIRTEFEQLFPYQIQLFFEEMCSVVVTPLILWFSLPKSSSELIEFVKQITVEVEGVGNVCGFAAFDFTKHGNPKFGSENAGPIKSAQGKMEKSFVNFVANYPNWTPSEDLGGSALLRKLHIQNYNSPLEASNKLPSTAGTGTGTGTGAESTLMSPLDDLTATRSTAMNASSMAASGSQATNTADEPVSLQLYRMLESYYESHEQSHSLSSETTSSGRKLQKGKSRVRERSKTPK